MNFNKDTLKVLRMELSKVLTQFGIEKGIMLELGNISYDEKQFTSKIIGYAGGKAEALNERYEDAFTAYATNVFGINKEIQIGTSIINNGTKYEVRGIDMKRRTKVVVLQNIANEKYANTDAETLNRMYESTRKFNTELKTG
jgi:hypothetical protein